VKQTAAKHGEKTCKNGRGKRAERKRCAQQLASTGLEQIMRARKLIIRIFDSQTSDYSNTDGTGKT
jgi:hypothetical protein